MTTTMHTVTAAQMEARRAADAKKMAGVATPVLAPATLTVRDGSLTVRVSWQPQDGLDRLNCYAWGLGDDTPNHRRLAARLIAAINDGAVIEPSDPYVDVDGNQGWHSRATILGRTMNADLRRLGY